MICRSSAQNFFSKHKVEVALVAVIITSLVAAIVGTLIMREMIHPQFWRWKPTPFHGVYILLGGVGLSCVAATGIVFKKAYDKVQLAKSNT